MPVIPANPTWVKDIAPVLLQKVRENKDDEKLASFVEYNALVKNKENVKAALAVPLTDQRSAAIPSALSDYETALLSRWLSSPSPLFMDISDPEQLKLALQCAIEVELATLPPYLTAMYSIDKDIGSNSAIYDVFMDIVMQEMAHFALACNMLISIGGSPDINSAKVNAPFPKKLPGGLRHDLTVNSTKFFVNGPSGPEIGNSRLPDQVLDFMSIESPLRVYKPKKNSKGIWFVDETCDLVEVDDTIGYMYEDILKSMETLHNDKLIEFGNAGHQVLHSGTVSVHKIRSIEDVKKAIDTIIEQGEGGLPTQSDSALDPVDDTTGEMAHFFRFSEMFYGRKIVRKSDKSGFSYSGDVVEIDKSGVYNMQDNPSFKGLDPTSEAYAVANTFAETYKGMLDSLQSTFSGNPTDIWAAISEMHRMGTDAVACMKTPISSNSDKTVGPPFQLPEA